MSFITIHDENCPTVRDEDDNEDCACPPVEI